MRPLILALDVTGHPSEWITWQEAITYQASDRVAHEMGEHESSFTGGLSGATRNGQTMPTRSIFSLLLSGPGQRMTIMASCTFLRPEALTVRCMSVWMAFKARISELFRTSAGYQPALSVCSRAGYPSGAFTMGSQL
jgi:hypothetical protein